MTADYIIHYWYVDFSSGALLHQHSGEQRRLGEYQLKLLLVLAEHAGKILTRDELNTLVWERRVIGNNSLPNAIHALRVALEDDGKQQRIIKTIPKKGYILEAEYCQLVSTTEQDAIAGIALSANDLLPVAEGEADADPLLAETAVTEGSPGDVLRDDAEATASPRHFWSWLVAAQAIILLGLLLWLFVVPWLTPVTKVIELDSAAYSNIRLFELERRQYKTYASEDLNRQLGTVLPSLNQMIKNQKVTMDVFFFASGTSLNYTLTLKNICGRKQLAMNILNWRMNGELLTALIYRETERKLNEMANCVN